MRAMSLRQPFAGALARRRCDVVLRWSETDYRGDILVHASKGRTWGDSAHPREHQRGVCVCIVELLDVQPFDRRGRVATAGVCITDAFWRDVCSRDPDLPLYAWRVRFKSLTPMYRMWGKGGLFSPPDAILRALGYTVPEHVGLSALHGESGEGGKN